MHAELGDFLSEIVQNAIESGGDVIRVEILQDPEHFEFIVSDNGRGIDRSGIERAMNPFYSDGTKHPGRRVGLGLPFLVQAVQAVEGVFEFESEPGKGTRVRGSFPLAHLDTPPLGDIVFSMVSCLAFPGSFEMYLRRTKIYPNNPKASLDYTIERNELLDALGGLETPGAMALIREYIESQEEEYGQIDLR